METVVNGMGKACPIPVIETKKALKNLTVGEGVIVEVDNEIAVQNLEKLAAQKKLKSSWEMITKSHYRVTLELVEMIERPLSDETEYVHCDLPHSSTQKTVVVIGSDQMGEGDEKLGRLLIKGFIYALTEQEMLPATILFYNKGVYLTAQDSEAITDLLQLEAQGVEILSCGTCLNHYGLQDQLAVGGVTNMYVILEHQMLAQKVIRP